MLRVIKAIKNRWAWRKILTEEDIYTVSDSTMEGYEEGGSIDAYTALKLIQGEPEAIRKWRKEHPVD